MNHIGKYAGLKDKEIKGLTDRMEFYFTNGSQ